MLIFLLFFYTIWFIGVLFLSISKDIVSFILIGAIYVVTIPAALNLAMSGGILEVITDIVVAVIALLFILQFIISIILN